MNILMYNVKHSYLIIKIKSIPPLGIRKNPELKITPQKTK